MFIDEITLLLQAGKGGDGIVAWRREKYIPKGGPYGGDGGDGGDIVLRSTTHETTLSKFRHKKKIKADDGERGGTWEKHGASAEKLVIEVPVGTLVSDAEEGEIIVDLSYPGQEFLICEGGRGGFGNAHFPSSTRRAPHFAELGDKGEERLVKMELKLVADIALVGLPNAGKSTLIQALTNVRPKIADYAFTTLKPNLGVMEWKGRSLVIEDVPGLIEGASEGRGLGFQFLKHIERCRALIHLIDASAGEEEMVQNYQTIRHELENWSEEMTKKEEFIIFSKADIVDSEHLEEMVSYFEKNTGKKVMMTISAGAYIRTDELKDFLLEKIPEREVVPIDKNISAKTAVYDLKKQKNPKNFTMTRLENGDFRVTGDRIEEIARMTDTRYPDGVGRVYDVMEKFGILRKAKHILREEIFDAENTGFFEGEEDFDIPSIWIGEKKFSLEGLIFMRGE